MWLCAVVIVRGLPSSASWQDLKVGGVEYLICKLFVFFPVGLVVTSEKYYRTICEKLGMSVLLRFLVTVKVLLELSAQETCLLLLCSFALTDIQ